MYEDCTIEERYLLNFTDLEKRLFRRKRAEKANQPELANTLPISPLEVRYILNRIYFDDPRDTAFTLGPKDKIVNGDAIAIRMGVAFSENTHCQEVRMDSVNLTDWGAGLILETFKKKSLNVLSLKGNDKLTDSTFEQIDRMLSEPQNSWKQVCLDGGQMSDKMRQRLMSHPNVILENTPKCIRICSRQNPIRQLSAEHTL